ncbi:adenylate cyclase type 10 [Podarcis lilfordi]|uniref:Adenylate cyclase type 10 n=2 Tax=Podarcis lilfordi TaxID=74358 RepID=A0AA35KFV6_9SAUR|nr:adenylate cyclase type 10 [Podarcis lilfordi]
MTSEDKKQFEISNLGKVAAHVPDLIVYGDFSQEVPFIESFDGVLLFVDISGFTALTEKFSMTTNLDRGADELTLALNNYVGDIVEEVLVFGGDVLKFAGDALLALWKVERCHINDIITLALKCSFSIQQEYGVRDTEVGLELRVKIGLSAGHISKVVVGDNRHQYFLVIGRAVDEVRLAQNLAKASEIILSPNCWELCDRKLIEVEKIKDERAVKVRYIRNTLDFDAEEFFDRCTQYLYQNRICDNFEILRNASVLPPNDKLEKCLRKYVMRNILRKIDDNQPLEYLSELRPVTIVFVNLQFDESANTHHLCKAIQDANTKIAAIIYPLSGKINKVFMFDKGCTLLCIFGLPGDKQSDEGANALDSANKIHAFCSTALMKVRLVSIGVTSGPVFCGVVGHRLRHEYTVIGRKVNLAARMMMYYPGVVTCDAVTCVKSKLPSYFFEELPLIEMKGVLNPGTVYKFLGVTEKTMIYKAYLSRERCEYYPLLGRKKETDLFENLLSDFKADRKSRIIIYEGLMGYGKSQLLAEIAYLGQDTGHRVVAMELTKINVWQNFFVIRTLMAMFLGIDTCKTYDARQYILVTRIRGVVKEEYFCLLNNLYHVKFPTSEEVSKMSNEAKNEKLENILVNILKNAVMKEVLIFVIDEAQFMDPASWDFLENLLSDIGIFVVMSLSPSPRKGRLPCAAAARLMSSEDTTYVQLRELTPSVIVQKACQDLGVVSIARELETFLIQRSHGNPLYCEELLRNLHLNNVLQFHMLEEDEEREDEWDNLFTVTALKTQTSRTSRESDSYICTITQNVKMHNIMLPPTLKGIALAELDNMNPSEQMVVKCAAIIGVTFSTELLFHILPEWTKMKMNQTLAALVESHIFKCFGERKEMNTNQIQDELSNELCFSPKAVKSMGQESDLGMVVANRLKQEESVMQCKVMGFCTPLLQEAAYELWLKSQKRALHLKCASYLESQAHRCLCCGGGDFIPFHRYAVDGMLHNIDPQGTKATRSKESILNEAASTIVSITLKKLDQTDQGGLNEDASMFVPFQSSGSIARSFPTSETAYLSSIKQCASERFLGSSNEILVSDTWMENRINRRNLSKEELQGRPSLQESFRAEDIEMKFLERMDEIIMLTEMGKKRIKNLSSCECEEIVEYIIIPLSQHCVAVEDTPRAFYYLLESACGYVHLSNNYMAFTYLNTAELMLKSVSPKQRNISLFEESVLHSLKGEVSYNMGQINLAKKLVKKALRLLKRSFPMTIIGAFFKSMVETSKHLSHQKKQVPWQMSSGREKKLAFLYQQGHCLSLLWQLFSLDLASSSKKFSRLAALMNVNCAEESQDESQIISSYMEFSLCCQLMGYQHEWMKYELMAIQRSAHLRVVGEELLIIAKLATSLAYMKLCLGNLPLAVQLGYRAHELCVQLKKPKLDCIVLNDLFNALFLRTRYQDSVHVLSWLEDLSMRDDNVIGQACFVTGCLDLMLYAGFSFKSFDFCLDFVLNQQMNCILMSQNSIMLGLYSSLAIWCGRLQEWDDFMELFEQARRLVRRTSASLYANHGFCKFVECEALLLRKYIEERPGKAREMRNKITKNLEQAIAQCSTSPVYYSRVYHMKAYVQLMLGQDENSQSFLEKAFEDSEMYGNHLEQSWLEITKEWWFTGKSPMEDYWLKTAPDFPIWEVGMAEKDVGAFHKNKYLLNVPELDIDNPFPDSVSEDEIS